MKLPTWLIGVGIVLAALAAPGISILFMLLVIDFWWSVIR